MTDDLVDLALTDTDFIGDLDPRTLADNAANSADLAAEISEDRTGIAVPLDVIQKARALLVERGYLILAEREQEAIDRRLEGQQAGDLNSCGDPIGYDTYLECQMIRAPITLAIGLWLGWTFVSALGAEGGW